ncbi:MAG: glycosyltransferase family 2 protein [Anaerolineales bacterium]
MPLLSIIIVNLNGAAVLPQCLAALAAQTWRDFELIIVDNGSTDGSLKGAEACWPALRVIRLGENTGFARANNIGAQAARGPWLALLNNDAFPTPTWLEALIRAAETHPAYTFFSSKIIQHNAPHLLDSTGDVYHVSGVAWNRQRNHPTPTAVATPNEVFSPMASAALYRRDAFLEVGGFDEDFVSYHEDIDLGFRLRLAGYRCLYVPEAVAYHIGSHTMGYASDFAIQQGHRNFVWAYVQNMPTALFWRYLPAHLLANLVFSVVLSVRGQAGPILRAKWGALRGLPRALEKRQTIQRARRASNADLLRVMDRGFLSPYILGRRQRKCQQQYENPPP